MMKIFRYLPLLSVFIWPGLLAAHTGHGSTAGFLHGFAHPLGGLDHICAMVAVGIWAAQLGKRAVYIVPAAFIVALVLGDLLGLLGLQMPYIEQGIIFSVFILGLLIALSVRMPIVFGSVLVALFALFHGYAHGAEIPPSVSGTSYALGFVLSTALLHASGIVGARFFQKHARPMFRFAGAAIMLCGVYLALAA